MLKPVVTVCGALVLAVAGSGCVSLQEHKDLQARYSALAEAKQRTTEDLGRENARLQLELEKSMAMNEMSKAQRDALGLELAAAKQIKDEIMKKFEGMVLPEGSASSGDIEVFNDMIRFSGEVLFDPGKTEIKAKGKEILLDVAKTLKEKGLFVQVDGHTDSDPIKRSLGKFPSGSNFELGAERALAVVVFLQKEGGLDPAKLHLSSWAEHQPAEAGNKKRNRRVEIRFSETDPYQTPEEK